MQTEGPGATRFATLTLILCAVAAAGGCGQTGALYLPDDDRPQQAAGEATPPDDEPDDDEQ